MKKQWKRLSQEDFIKKAQLVHNNRYDYSNTVFTTVNDKVTISCKNHGDFIQNANQHLLGSKCKKCAMEDRSKVRTKSTEEFIKSAIATHGNRYSYSKASYTKFSDKIIITCQTHGDFEQHAGSHIRGANCPKCVHSAKTGAWSYSDWETAGTKSKEFEGYQLYILRCFNETESFFKIGKTFVNLNRRYDCVSALPYRYIIEFQLFGDARTISELEVLLLSKYKEYKYVPAINFHGNTECIQIPENYNIQELVNNYITNKGNLDGSAQLTL